MRKLIRYSIQNALCKQIMLALALLTIARFIWFSANVFWLPAIGIKNYLAAFVLGIYFDIPVATFFFAPVWLWVLFAGSFRDQYPKVNRLLFVLSAMVCLVLNAIDTGYSKITGKRSGYELFQQIGDGGNNILSYLSNNVLSLLGLLMAAILIYRLVPTQKKQYPKIIQWKKPLQSLFLVVLSAGIGVLGYRGGWQLRPLRCVDAANFSYPEIMPLIGSTPLQMMGSWQRSYLPAFRFSMGIGEAEILVYGGRSTSHWQHGTIHPKPNIVILVVESLARDYTGFGNGNLYTPYLNSLAGKSLYFPYCFANGTKSIEMVPSIFCGLPNLMSEFYINSAYSNNFMRNAFGLAKDQGYKTAFFHGANNGTMGFRSFLLQNGLATYHGINEYPHTEIDFDGNWGIFDSPYLQHVSHCLDTMTKPFFTGIFTLSSHHPYTIPRKYANGLPGKKETIQHSIAYTDIALQQFFATASKSDWFNNTIFVITGDHTSHSDSEYFYSQSGHYEIPLLFYSPGHLLPKSLHKSILHKSISQCDIIPTLWQLLGSDNPRFGFGRSALDLSYLGYSTHFDKNLYTLIQYPYVLGLDENGKMLDYHKQIRNRNKGEKLIPSGVQFDWMNATLKAQMLLFSHTLRNNSWQ
ncbi:MAG: sulfatase-like hydrolase/transferase [Bacteroidetes bacterium]|nr:sulfatase-like hydrolase/transferase [Bacteroidota bacterium]